MTRTKRPTTTPFRSRKSKSAPHPKATASAATPERGLKIGEAARLIDVETYVLRFWETQFPFLKPKHSRTKHRFYHDRDLEVLRLIKSLLHRQGFTIAGANKFIREHSLDALLKGYVPGATTAAPASAAQSGSSQPAIDGATRRVLNEVRRDLENLRKLLER
jgi:DNA-binding transcriptional MerR regulator